MVVYGQFLLSNQIKKSSIPYRTTDITYKCNNNYLNASVSRKSPLKSNSNKLPDYLLTSKSTFFSITCESNILAQDHEDRAEPDQRLYRLLLNATECNLAQTRVHAQCLPIGNLSFFVYVINWCFNYFF